MKIVKLSLYIAKSGQIIFPKLFKSIFKIKYNRFNSFYAPNIMNKV